MDTDVAIEARGISKSFGNAVANADIDLVVRAGQIHALLGENGAGKSTLMNMLAGIYQPDRGEIAVYGRRVTFASPADSIRYGIGMIHQHFKLVDVMSAADNILLGQPGGLFVNKRSLVARIRAVSDRYGLDVDPHKKVYDMSVGEKQTLEIIRVLLRDSKILIMDEPTAVLTPTEIQRLFTIVRGLRDAGCAVVIITHKLNEVMEVSDVVTVLRHGRVVGRAETRKVALPTLIEMVVGRTVDLKIERPVYGAAGVVGAGANGGVAGGTADGSGSGGTALLTLDKVTVVNKDKKTALRDVSFTVNAGEIVGVAGVAGSGQKELCETVAGLTRASGGRIFFGGANILGKSPREITDLGIRIGFIPEDRLGMGLVAGMDIISNIILKDYRRYPGPLLRRAPSVAKAQTIVQRLDVLTPSLTTPVSRLSGGNIQKILLGREIDSDPRVLITAYPVRGLDIGASYKIYELLNEQKLRGVGIVFIGEDLDVLLELCDRIVVLSGGRVTGVVEARRATKEELGFLMTGGTSVDATVATVAGLAA
ncbi:MAG: ABC transporter ATP-binding protein [Actinomycetes bacterium]|jgi:simple sugar transport system ATP-binding protein|nr:ABC transporter ATP-binding protein [Actinomycetes bacterium]